MDTSTLIQAKKQARNLLNKLLKCDGLDPNQRKQLTTVSRSLHYQIKDLANKKFEKVLANTAHRVII